MEDQPLEVAGFGMACEGGVIGWLSEPRRMRTTRPERMAADTMVSSNNWASTTCEQLKVHSRPLQAFSSSPLH